MEKSHLRFLEVFLNSGQLHLSFNEQGERRISSDPTVFTERDQLLLSSVIVSSYCRAIQESMSIHTADLCAAAAQWSSAGDVLEIPALMGELSRRAAARTFFNNKLSELEVVIAANSLPAMAALDRGLLHDLISEGLHERSGALSRADSHVFVGLEYAKVTLFDKKTVAEKVLAGMDGGTVLSLGDSAVDLPFLRLRPKGVEYFSWWLGEEVPPDGLDGLSMPACPAIQGAMEVLSAFSRSHAGRLRAVIADIDSSICELAKPLCAEMVELLNSLLQSGVRIVLITGAGSLESCERRILKPLLGSCGPIT